MLQSLGICVLVVLVSRTYGQFQLGFGTPTPVGPKTFDPNCRDVLSNCWDFPISSCQAPYVQWATDNCPNRCGICWGPTTAAPPCVDTLPNCDAYDTSICSSSDYKNWASKNCKLFCRMCPADVLAQIDASRTTSTISPANCKDKTDCRLYGPDACTGKYRDWAKVNCPAHCNFCQPLPTAPPVCADKIPNCKQYDADTCTNPMYNLWVEDNCRSFCGKCSGVSTIAYNVPSPPAPPGKKRSNVVKRQFEASHHHNGESHKCWDHNSNDPDCINISPPAVQSTVQPVAESSTADFPGSDIRPNHKPPPDWDSKPSSGVSVATSHTKLPVDTTTETLTSISTKTSVSGITDIGTQSTGNPSTPTPGISTTTTAEATLTPSANSDSTTVTQEKITTADSTTNSSAQTVTTQTSGNTFSTAITGTANTLTPNVSSATETTTSTRSTVPVPVTKQSANTTTSKTFTPPTAKATDITPKNNSPVTQRPTLSNSTMGVPPTLAPSKATESTTTTSTTPTITMTETRTPSTTATTPTTTTMQTTTPCADTIPNCAGYGVRMCQRDVYRAWAQAHCAASCNFCTPEVACVDKNDKCNEYDDGRLCVSEDYYAWAKKNCLKYCKFPPCGNNTIHLLTEPQTTPSTIATTTEKSNCKDVLDNCIYYPDEKCVGIYKPWATAHCAKRCGYCNESLPCVDNNPDCDKYPPGICTDASYTGWARQNCRQFCNLCQRPTQPPTDSSNPSQQTNTPGIGPTGTPPTPASPVKSAEPSIMSHMTVVPTSSN